MVERIHEVKITVMVDTNKTTYEKEFRDIEEAQEYLAQILRDIRSE